MNRYSPVKSIYVKNFRSIGEVQIDFEESPIVSLIGENDSGKTSIIKAFGVCALHAYPRDQKGFIRDGTKGFGIAIELIDGTLITRMKTEVLNKYNVKSIDGQEWDTNKIDSGLPLQVHEAMGLMVEPETKEYLQLRTYEDQLLFVTTKASTNYKVMYDALKVDQLTKAIKLGSTEVNKLGADINENEISMAALTNNLRDIRIYDLEPILNIKNRLEEQINTLEKVELTKKLADDIADKRVQLGLVGQLEKYGVEHIDLVEVNRLNSIYRLSKNKSDLSKLLKINNKVKANEEIDTSIISRLSNIINKRNKLESKIQESRQAIKIVELEEIEEYTIQQLNRAIGIKKKVSKSNSLLDIIDKPGCDLILQEDFDTVRKIRRAGQLASRNNELSVGVYKYTEAIQQLENILRQCGSIVVECDNCGEQMVLDIEELDIEKGA